VSVGAADSSIGGLKFSEPEGAHAVGDEGVTLVEAFFEREGRGVGGAERDGRAEEPRAVGDVDEVAFHGAEHGGGGEARGEVGGGDADEGAGRGAELDTVAGFVVGGGGAGGDGGAGGGVADVRVQAVVARMRRARTLKRGRRREGEMGRRGDADRERRGEGEMGEVFMGS
jgi:hypothetical protein